LDIKFDLKKRQLNATDNGITMEGLKQL